MKKAPLPPAVMVRALNAAAMDAPTPGYRADLERLANRVARHACMSDYDRAEIIVDAVMHGEQTLRAIADHCEFAIADARIILAELIASKRIARRQRLVEIAGELRLQWSYVLRENVTPPKK